MTKRLVFSFGGAIAMAMTLRSCTGDPVAPELVSPRPREISTCLKRAATIS
jgi:hypothetical protein